jgi:ABC-type phosphonate transport system ATPase subunit
VVVLGLSGSGKSTLIGVIASTAIRDNGKGFVRSHVLYMHNVYITTPSDDSVLIIPMFGCMQVGSASRPRNAVRKYVLHHATMRVF